MTARLALIAAAAGLALPTAASAQDSQSTPDKSALIQSCADRKFETVVNTTVDGKPHGQKVKICGVAGQSDEDWRHTLEDAAEKVEANAEMDPAAKEQIISALKLEIAKLDTAAVRPTKPVASTTLIPNLPGLPKAGTATATPPRRTAPPEPRTLEQDYGSLKPLPPPLPPVTATLGPASASALQRLASPRIKLLCSTQADSVSEECGDVYQNTIFTIRADESLTGGTSLRFLRKGDDRADVELAQMKLGQTVRIALPKRVCTGVNRSTLEIQVLRRPQGSATPQVVDSHGPYYLRCSSLDF